MLLNRLKIVFQYSSCRSYSKINQSRKDMLKLFAEFGMSGKEATRFVNKYKLKNLNSDHVKSIVSFCQGCGYSFDEIFNCPEVFKTKPITLDQRYLTLKEGGFYPLQLKYLTNFRSIINKPVKTLKNHGCIPEQVNVASNLATYLKPKPRELDVSDLTDDKAFASIHRTVTKRYLIWRLEANQHEIEKIFRVHKSITNKSFQNLCLNIAIAEELDFTPHKLKKYGYLLHNYPKYPLTVLSKMPQLAGIDLAQAMRKHPKLITVSPQNYVEIYDILKGAKITDEMIRKTPSIFQLSPQTIKLRLEEIRNIPDTRVHLNNPRILQLIVNHNRGRSRLSFLQQSNLNCASCGVLVDNGNSFNTHIRKGQDVNLFHELREFLMALLKVEKELIENNIKKHPLHLQVPLAQIEQTYNYLRTLKFNNQSIVNVVQILLYPKDRIKSALDEIKNNIEVPSTSLNQSQKLNLALYLIEKEHHFNGNGIWKKDNNFLEN